MIQVIIILSFNLRLLCENPPRKYCLAVSRTRFSFTVHPGYRTFGIKAHVLRHMNSLSQKSMAGFVCSIHAQRGMDESACCNIRRSVAVSLHVEDSFGFDQGKVLDNRSHARFDQCVVFLQLLSEDVFGYGSTIKLYGITTYRAKRKNSVDQDL